MMTLNKRSYCDCVLRINVGNGEVSKEPLVEQAARLLIGGKGLGAYYLYKELPAGIDPLSSSNLLILQTGPLTGTTAPTAGRFGSTTKSPATGTYSDSYCGGFFGQTLKYAGYDLVIFSGAAAEPVLVVIEDGNIQTLPTKDLWGKTIPQTVAALAERYPSDGGWQSLVIGPPGEKLSNIAGIFNETRALARGGVGAVMGSKRIKAIVARGTGTVRVDDRAAFDRANQLAYRGVRMSSVINRLKVEGTANILELVNALGALPTNNFQSGQFAGADDITGETWKKQSWVRDYACFGCPINCSKVTREVDGKQLEGPEYETIYALGSNCGISNQEWIIRMAQVCDEYGIDTISAGAIAAFVMEAFEKGIIPTKDLDGLEPRFGDCQSALVLIEKMAKVEGCGEWLSQGVARIAENYPQTKPFAMHVKGLEMPAYHPNAAKGTALGYAVSERGACHLRGAPLSEVLGGANPLSISGKARLFRDHQSESALYNSAVLCHFPSYGMTLKELYQLVKAATGFDIQNVHEFEKIGERINTLCRLFNTREGFDRAQDSLPERALHQPLVNGPACGHVVELDPMLDEYYALVGWNKNGVPSMDRISELANLLK